MKNNIFKNEKECNSRGLPPFKMKEDKDENGFKKNKSNGNVEDHSSQENMPELPYK